MANEKYTDILNFLKVNPSSSSKEIFNDIGEKPNYYLR